MKNGDLTQKYQERLDKFWMRPAPFSAASCWFSTQLHPNFWDATHYMVPGVVFTSAFWWLKSYSCIFVLKKTRSNHAWRFKKHDSW
jgi:hypothetical protein